MRAEYSSVPTKDGVFGPEILVGTADGAACLRAEDGSINGDLPSGSLTNAFMVRASGRPVLVVSEGVQPERAPLVSERLRTYLGDGSLAVLFDAGAVDGSAPSFRADDPSGRALGDLALAAAYVLVQCAWVEGDELEIRLDARRFRMAIGFQGDVRGSLHPHISHREQLSDTGAQDPEPPADGSSDDRSRSRSRSGKPWHPGSRRRP